MKFGQQVLTHVLGQRVAVGQVHLLQYSLRLLRDITATFSTHP